MKYPKVLSEAETIERVLDGQGLCRFGDGELKLARDQSCKVQTYSPPLGILLRKALRHPSPNCLTAIPNVKSDTPKKEFWTQFAHGKYVSLYDPDYTYGSSFVSRSDSAPWIDTPEYWERLRTLWKGRDVVLVRGGKNSLTASRLLPDVRTITEVLALPRHAFDECYDALFETLRREKRLVLMSLGPTATALCYMLSFEKVWAVDLGYTGMFMKRGGHLPK